MMQHNFIPGLDLCESFFKEIALPIIKAHYPQLRFSAGLVGYGSDVIGFDDPMSIDHMWGPRFYLFLEEADLPLAEALMALFAQEFPLTYQGYPVNFSAPDPDDNGVRHMELIEQRPISPLVWIDSLRGHLGRYLGTYLPDSQDPIDWLCVSEHRLLGATSGRIFYDDLNVEAERQRIAFYPQEVQLYLLASQWALIAEEQAFITRTGVRGDEIGTRLITGRILERIMRLYFHYRKRYAPYSKWFGSAFVRLSGEAELNRHLVAAIQADTWQVREEAILEALVKAGELHNQSGLTEPLDLSTQPYFGRPIRVLQAERFAEALQARLEGSVLRKLPLIGSLSQVANLTVLSDDPVHGFPVQKRIFQALLDESAKR